MGSNQSNKVNLLPKSNKVKIFFSNVKLCLKMIVGVPMGFVVFTLVLIGNIIQYNTSFESFFKSNKTTKTTRSEKVLLLLSKIFWLPIWVFYILPVRAIQKIKGQRQ